jgi:argininosuccinate lyase
MPHKKNPDVFELIRGKCNAIQSITNELNLITTNLTSGYHRDMQLLKERIIQGINEIKKCIELTNYSIKKIKIRENILDDKKYEYSFTVENLNKLVNSGLSFRDAYIKISESIKKGNYIPEKNIEHNLIGSINNLCLDEIRVKMKNYFN